MAKDKDTSPARRQAKYQLFSDNSVEKSKPLATPTKRRKTVKSASDKP